MKMIQPYVPHLSGFLDVAATVLILGLVSLMSLYIAVRMVRGVQNELAEQRAAQQK